MCRGKWLLCVMVTMVAMTSMVVLSGCADEEVYSTYRTSDGRTYAGDQGMNGATGTQARDIVSVARDSGRFSKFDQALEMANLDDMLRGEGPYTVFAPNDQAFDQLPDNVYDNLMLAENRDTLRQILQYHIASGKMMSRDLKDMDQFDSLSGKTSRLSTQNGTLKIGKAQVISADIRADNGVIHEIDAVLIPDNLQNKIQELSKPVRWESQQRFERNSQQGIQQQQQQQQRNGETQWEGEQRDSGDVDNNVDVDTDNGKDIDIDTDDSVNGTDVKIEREDN